MITSRLSIVALLALQMPMMLASQSLIDWEQEAQESLVAAYRAELAEWAAQRRAADLRNRDNDAHGYYRGGIKEYLGGHDNNITGTVIPISVGYTVEGENKDRALYSKEILWAHAGMLLYSALYGVMNHDADAGRINQRFPSNKSHGLYHMRKNFGLYLGTVLAARLVRHGYNFWMGPARRQAKKVVGMIQNAEPARQGAAA